MTNHDNSFNHDEHLREIMKSCISKEMFLMKYCFCKNAANGNKTPAIVTEVYDGDTFTAVVVCGQMMSDDPLQRDCVSFKVRMLGIDCPEIKKSSTDKSQNKLDEIKIAKKAKQFIIDNCMDKGSGSLKLVWLGNVSLADKYGRLLADVYLDQFDEHPISMRMINEGLAYGYRGDTKDPPVNWNNYYLEYQERLKERNNRD